MRKIIFVILLMLISIPVYAKEETFYYNSERVESMWITKVKGSEMRSAHPYLIKKRSDNTYIFCLEPFTLLQNDTKYVESNDYKKYGLTEQQINRINLLIYYGFGYKNHTTPTWYGVTQYLIWKECDKEADIYFTETKGGPKKALYTKEINEIEALIKEHDIEPTFEGNYQISTNEELVVDSNIDLSNYEIESNAEYELKDNKLIFKNLDVGNYKVNLTKKTNRFKSEFMMYYSTTSQNVIVPGHSKIYDKNYTFNIDVLKGKVSLSKISNDSHQKLKDAIYGVYQNDELITKITTGSDGIGEAELPFGEYIIKELVAPKGYKLDPNEYKITIDENNLDIKLTLYDDKEIIKVPDTGLEKHVNFGMSLIIIGSIGLIYGKKKHYMY